MITVFFLNEKDPVNGALFCFERLLAEKVHKSLSPESGGKSQRGSREKAQL